MQLAIGFTLIHFLSQIGLSIRGGKRGFHTISMIRITGSNYKFLLWNHVNRETIFGMSIILRFVGMKFHGIASMLNE